MGYGKIEPSMKQKGQIYPDQRNFQSPEQIYDLFNEYRIWLLAQEEAGEWARTHFVGKDGTEKKEKVYIPMTLVGFKTYVYKTYKKSLIPYIENTGGKYEEFKEIVAIIREEIKDKQITGGLLNHYNSSITARLNNLHETQNVNHGSIDKIEIKVVK